MESRRHVRVVIKKQDNKTEQNKTLLILFCSIINLLKKHLPNTSSMEHLTELLKVEKQKKAVLSSSQYRYEENR